MASLLMLDTDIASYIIKARYPSVDARYAPADPMQICVSAVTQSELLYGLKDLDPVHRRHISARRFLRDTTILAWGEEAAEIHADVRHRLKISGRAFGAMDMMIAAHAVSLGAIVVTNNTRHFGRLAPALTIENWVADPRG